LKANNCIALNKATQLLHIMSQSSFMSAASSITQDDKHLDRMMEVTGNQVSKKAEEALAKAFVNDQVWRNCKFLQPEDLVDGRIVSNMVRKHLGYKKKDWGPVWERYMKETIKAAMNKKRNNVAQSIGNQEDKSKCVNKGETHVPTLRCQSLTMFGCCLLSASILPTLTSSRSLQWQQGGVPRSMICSWKQ
jgi:hypothetical protein